MTKEDGEQQHGAKRSLALVDSSLLGVQAQHDEQLLITFRHIPNKERRTAILYSLLCECSYSLECGDIEYHVIRSELSAQCIRVLQFQYTSCKPFFHLCNAAQLISIIWTTA